VRGITGRVDAVDRFQQRRAWLAVPVATWKKFQDDQAGNLAALIAYYGFVALFPLLLVFGTVLCMACSASCAACSRGCSWRPRSPCWRRKWTWSSRGACGRGR
jgi:hypothetical protein